MQRNNRKLEFLVKWSVLSDSLWRKTVMSIILSCVWEEFLLLCVCIPYIFTKKYLMCFMCFVCWACVNNMFCVICVCQEWTMWCILYKKKRIMQRCWTWRSTNCIESSATVQEQCKTLNKEGARILLKCQIWSASYQSYNV